MSSATDLMIELLREAESTEQASLSALESHLRGAPPGPFRSALRRHHDETRRHAQQIGERLQSLGATRSTVQTAWTVGEAVVGRVAGLALAPLHLLTGRDEPVTLLRHLRDDIGLEAREVATYQALERLADAAGDRTTASLARAIRDDEVRQLQTLRGLLEPISDRIARERLGDRPQQPPEPQRRPSRPAGESNGGPVKTERETPYKERAARRREARRQAGHTPEGPSRAQMARVHEQERAQETPVESEGVAAPHAEVHVEAPWAGYDDMKASEIVERLRSADPTVRAMARLYEQNGKNRKSIIAATGG